MTVNQLSLFDQIDRIRRQAEVEASLSDDIRLRPYQSESVDRVFEEWDGGATSTLICLPTGTGKSVCFSAIMKKWVGRHGG